MCSKNKKPPAAFHYTYIRQYIQYEYSYYLWTAGAGTGLNTAFKNSSIAVCINISHIYDNNSKTLDVYEWLYKLAQQKIKKIPTFCGTMRNLLVSTIYA